MREERRLGTICFISLLYSSLSILDLSPCISLLPPPQAGLHHWASLITGIQPGLIYEDHEQTTHREERLDFLFPIPVGSLSAVSTTQVLTLGSQPLFTVLSLHIAGTFTLFILFWADRVWWAPCYQPLDLSYPLCHLISCLHFYSDIIKFSFNHWVWAYYLFPVGNMNDTQDRSLFVCLFVLNLNKISTPYFCKRG